MTTDTPKEQPVMVDLPVVGQKEVPVSDADAAKIGKEVAARYVPPPTPEKTTMELIEESKKSAEAQAAKEPPDKDTQGQPAGVAGGASP